MIENILRFFTFRDPNVQYVLFGSMLLGAASGILGSFAVLRKRSLLGDALAHAALPGICLAFMITASKSLVPLLAGATISGVLGVLVMQMIIKSGRIKPDSAIGIVLSVFFGIGIVLLTVIQRGNYGNQSGLDNFLFGQAASVIPSDLIVMGIVSAIILILVIALFKEFRLLTFDADFLSTVGFPVTLIDLILMSLIVLNVMVGLQAVGVILMAAILITPAVAARFWTHRLNFMILLAGLFGATAGFLGTFTSSLAPGIPTGPIIVLSATLIFIFSALFAPVRGALPKWLQHLKNRRSMLVEHALRAFVELEEMNDRKKMSLSELAGHIEQSRSSTKGLIKKMIRLDLADAEKKYVSLTESGVERANRLVKTHRLWEYYLIHRTKLQRDHVHRDADQIEHILSPQVIENLEQILQSEGIDTNKLGSIHPLAERK